MKKLILIVVILLLAAAGAAGLALYNANALIAQYKPAIEGQLSKAIGTPIHLGEIETTLIPKTSLRVAQAAIGDPNSQAQGGPNLGELLLELNLVPLLKKRLEVTTVRLVKPELNLIRDEHGVRVIGMPERQPAAPKEAVAGGKPVEQGGVNLSIEAVRIEEGRVALQDETLHKQFLLEQINLQTKIVLEGGNIAARNLKIAAKLLEKLPLEVSADEITLAGDNLSIPTLLILLNRNKIAVETLLNKETKDGTIRLNSKEIDLASLQPLFELVPAVAALELTGKALPRTETVLTAGSPKTSGALGLENLALRQGDYKMSGISGSLEFTAEQDSQTAKTSDLKLSVNDTPFSAAFAAAKKGTAITVSAIKATAFDGEIAGDLIGELGEKKVFSTDLQVSKLNLGKALQFAAKGKPASFSGTVESLKATIGGTIGPELKNSLKGNLSLLLRDGELKGVNILGEVLGKISQLPVVSGALDRALSPEERAVIAADSTTLKTVQGSFALGAGKMNTDNLKVESGLFNLAGRGTIGLDSSLDLKTTFYFAASLVSRLVASNKNMELMLNENRELVVPLELHGTPPKVLVVPDLAKLLEVGAKAAAKQKAGELLEKVAPKVKGLDKLLGF